MRRLLPPAARALAGVVVAVVLVVGPGASAASAHDALAGSTPAAGATAAIPPTGVRLEFGDPPQTLGAQVRVTGPDGAAVTAGAAEVEGTTVSRPLAGGLPAGTYTVDWRVVSADGHPVSGSFTFTAAAAAPGSATAPAGPGPQAPGPAASSAVPSDSSSPWVWLVAGAIVIGAAAPAVRQLRRPA